jgi:sugar lactone lactonase YvrE
VGEPDTGPWVPPVDCSAIPQGPFELAPVQGAMASEDIAFDKLGHVVGSNDKAIFKTAYGGAPQVFVPKLDFRAGMRYLPNGHLVVCNNYKGQLDRIDEKGEVHVLLTGLSYPNGITVDMKGFVYFTEHDANQVWRVDPFTGDKSLLTNKIANPNGITFSVDYRTLYIGGFSGVGTVYSMSISEDGVPGKLVPFATGVGTGWLDGMGVDACGNVYIADYGATIIYRISPDGQTNTPIVNGSSLGAYLPNLDWGSGIGGWDTESIYLPNGWQKGVFEVDLGVPSKPLPYP